MIFDVIFKKNIVMKTVGKITNTWKKALKHIKNNETDQAINTLDQCLLILAQETVDEDTELDGVKVDLWKVRVWVKLEELGAVPAYDEKI
jgi:hypothetical protein